MKNNDQHFLKLFRNNLVGMIITDEDHIIVDVNEHLLHLTEMEAGDIIGKTGLEIGILNEEFVKTVWQQLMENGRVSNQELSFTSKNNKRLDILFSTEKIELDNKTYWLTTIVDISKRKKSEKTLSNIYERVTDAFVAIDKNWHYTYVNKKAGELLEKDPEYLVGQHIWTEFPEDVGQPVYLAYHEAMETQRMITMEEYYEPYDRWFQNLIYPSADGLSVFFSDITKRKKAEEKIRESELRFRTLTKNAPVGIFETDAKGLTTYVNETWMRFTGMQFEEALGEGWLNAVHPEDKKKLIEGWYSKSEKAQNSVSEYRLVDKTGKQIWVNGNAVPVIDDGGKVTGYIGTINDVTEIKNAMQLLESSEENKRLILNSAHDGVIIIDSSSKIIFWNPQAEKIFGWTAAEATGRTLDETIIPSEFRSLHHSGLQHYLQTGEGPILNRINEITAVNKQGILFPVELTILPIQQEQTTTFCGFIRDITVKKKADEALQKRTEQLRELSTHLQNIREDERMNIAREIHDELGQQLTGLKMDVAWLMKKSDLENGAIKAKFDDMLKLVDATVRSIRRIATELRPSIIDDLGLNAALEWLVSELGERMNTNIQFENDFDDKQINPDISIGLFRILQESLTNIAKHANANQVLIILKKVDEAVHLSVADDGVGFDNSAGQRQRTFGLLGISERTYMMQGEYEIFTEPGEGTKIKVSIPLR